MYSIQWLHAIEHSENKIITQSRLTENEIGPGVLLSSVLRQTQVLQENQRQNLRTDHYVSNLSVLGEILTGCLFDERWTSALCPNLVSKSVIILFLECSICVI